MGLLFVNRQQTDPPVAPSLCLDMGDDPVCNSRRDGVPILSPLGLNALAFDAHRSGQRSVGEGVYVPIYSRWCGYWIVVGGGCSPTVTCDGPNDGEGFIHLFMLLVIFNGVVVFLNPGPRHAGSGRHFLSGSLAGVCQRPACENQLD